MPTIDINDTTVYYKRTGGGPAVLFVHGMCGDAEVWADQARRLCDRYTCVRYDRRGHSRSHRGNAVITDALHAGDVAALVEPSAWRRACWSHPAAAPPSRSTWPCATAICSAARCSASRRCSAGPRRRQGHDGGTGPAPRGDNRGGRAPIGRRRVLLAPLSRSVVDHRRARKDRYRDNADIGLTGVQSPSLDVTAADLAAVSVPALVLAGDTSHPSLRSVAHRLAEALPRFVELDHCGHVTYAEQPDAFANAVSVFAAEVDRRGAITAS